MSSTGISIFIFIRYGICANCYHWQKVGDISKTSTYTTTEMISTGYFILDMIFVPTVSLAEGGQASAKRQINFRFSFLYFFGGGGSKPTTGNPEK